MKNLFNFTNKLKLILVFILLSTGSFASDYFWVNGTGNWSEFGLHWATTSGGAVMHTGTPTSEDNVFFDENSFVAPGDIVTVDVEAFCNNMDWTNATNNPDLGGFSSIHIYGSIKFIPQMTSTLSSQLLLNSSSAGNTLDFSTAPLNFWDIQFDGSGEWTFLSDLDLTIAFGSVSVLGGTVNTNGYTISCQNFQSWAGLYPRIINLSNSVINTNWWSLWDSSSITFNCGTSTINLTNNWFDGQGFHYYDVNFNLTFLGQVMINGSNTFHNLGFDSEFVSGVTFEAGKMNTINNWSFSSDCSKMKTVSSNIDGITATIKKITGTVQQDYLIVRDMEIIGGGNFITNNGIELSNVTNWTINPAVPRTLYWVGGTGNYSDPDHWALTSGASYPSGLTCPPTNADDVLFDNNSFTAPGQAVYIDGIAYCSNMTWTGVTNNPDLASSAGQYLAIFGTLILDGAMTISNTVEIKFSSKSAGNLIDFKNIPLNCMISFNNNGQWDLISNLTTTNQITLNNGTLSTNGFDVSASTIYSGSGNFFDFDMSNSNVTISSYLSLDNVNFILTATGSHIAFNGTSFYGGGHTFNNVNFNNTGTIFISGSNTFNIVDVPFGSSLSFGSGSVNTFTDLTNIAGDCSKLSSIKSQTIGQKAFLVAASGTITVDYAQIQDIDASGGAVFNANNSVDAGNVSGWNFTALPSTDYYWIGGAGNWNDPLNWSLSSGGAANPGGCIPTIVDNVHFDANSGLASATVTINTTAYCNNMDWTGVSNSARLGGTSQLNIYGSLFLDPNMILQHTGELSFKSNNPGNTINFQDKLIRGNVRFNGQGSWTLMSNMTLNVAGNKNVYFEKGNLVTNDFDITCNWFQSYTEDSRSLNLGNSNITVEYWYIYNGTNMTIIPGSSILTINTGTTFYGGSLDYNDVTMMCSGTVNLYGSNTFNNILMNNISTLSVESGTSQLFNTLNIPNGTGCMDYVIIKSSTAGSSAGFEMAAGTFNGDWLQISDITASGGGTFIATNSIGIGDVTGWTITGSLGTDLYWIGDGGPWSDPLHWSLTTGGAPYGCIPTINDNVYFDANSFSTANQIVDIDIEASCKNMDWTNATNNPEVSGWQNININGSLFLNPGISFNYFGTLVMTSNLPGNFINTYGLGIYNITFSGAGEYTLLSDIHGNWGNVIFNNGTLNTNDFPINMSGGSFISNSSNPRTINLGNSIITVGSWSIENSTNMVFNAGSSNIEMSTNGWQFLGGGLSYNHVLINPNGFSFNIFDSNTFGTLEILPGCTILFESSSIQNTTNFIANGNNGTLINLQSNTFGQEAFINQTAQDFCGDYLNIQDMWVGTTNFYAGENSIDNGNNSGWTWSGVTANDQYPSAYCEDSQGAGTVSGINLTALEFNIDGGNGYVHTWYSDPALTILVATPNNVTASNGQIFYDEVDNGVCTNIAEVIYTVYPLPVATFSETQPTCNGDGNGIIDLSVSSGTPLYAYLWSNSETTQDISGLYAGTYEVTITDAEGCFTIGTSILAEPDPLQMSIDLVSDVTCFGASNGSIDATTTGGTSPYSFSWTNTAQTSEDLIGLGPNSYDVSVTDNNGCTATNGSVISEPSAIAMAINQIDNVTCNGLSDGSIDIAASGGTGALQFIWSNSATSEDISGLNAGMYDLTITDFNLCEYTDNIEITQPALLTVSLSKTDASCFGSNDGEISTTVNGGTGIYSYSWSNGQSASVATGLQAGLHTVTVTDENNCSTSSSQLINEPTEIVIDFVVTDATCGISNGELSAQVSGGDGTYSYLWSTSATDNLITSLSVGTYFITVTDGAGCSSSASKDVNNVGGPVLNASVSDAICYGNCDGEITIGVSGGTSPYSYSWISGQSTETISGLCSGTYYVTVTDFNSCAASLSAEVLDPLPVQINLVISPVSCNGGSDGAMTANVINGLSPYIYEWAHGNSVETASNLVAGIYEVSVTDMNGCTANATDSVVEPEVLSNTFDITDVLCYGSCSGIAVSYPIGGNSPYYFNWSNGETTSTASGICAGTITLNITDANGCTVADSATINEPPIISASFNTNDAACGNSDGDATVLPAGGVGSFTFIWSSGGTDATETNLLAGIYQITITDDNMCSVTESVTIGNTGAPVVSYNVTNVLCFGDCQGAIEAVPTGGTLPYSYDWSTGSTDAIISNICAGDYYMTLTDNSGCIVNQMISVSEPDILTMTLSSTFDNGIGDGTATAIVAGGTSPYSYMWNDAYMQTTPLADSLPMGLYTVIVTDANGCIIEDSVQVDFVVSLDNDIPVGSVVAYPVPAREILNISINAIYGNIEIQFMDITGKTVYYERIANSLPNMTRTIDISDFASGVYSIRVISENSAISHRVIIE